MGLDLSRGAEITEREDRGFKVPLKDELGKVETYDEGGEKKPGYILVAGAHSSRYRRKKEALDRRKVDKNTFVEGKWTSDATELVIACVIDWRGVENKGQPIDCTPHNVRAIFEAYPHMLRACDEAINEPANFLSPSSQQPKDTFGPLSD